LQIQQLNTLLAIEERSPTVEEEQMYQYLYKLVELDDTRKNRFYENIKDTLGRRPHIPRERNGVEIIARGPSYVRFKGDIDHPERAIVLVCTGEDMGEESNWREVPLELSRITAADDPENTGNPTAFADFLERVLLANDPPVKVWKPIDPVAVAAAAEAATVELTEEEAAVDLDAPAPGNPVGNRTSRVEKARRELRLAEIDAMRASKKTEGDTE
tara:strand:- start:47413 stop:48057 length:645 start_codon:yes stop_codon:yes gene_type:complete